MYGQGSLLGRTKLPRFDTLVGASDRLYRVSGVHSGATELPGVKAVSTGV